ncbi:MAG: hypothetical protein F4Y47_07180 [Acidobacteriia bacterium]|nr:hypothetical protein [Terriglobia bacterium]MYG03384.1 hypothetical protein [Terriglobia bacterium]MYK11601.1 hypothetical protein [Terriglobia bacterium]
MMIARFAFAASLFLALPLSLLSQSSSALYNDCRPIFVTTALFTPYQDMEKETDQWESDFNKGTRSLLRNSKILLDRELNIENGVLTVEVTSLHNSIHCRVSFAKLATDEFGNLVPASTWHAKGFRPYKIGTVDSARMIKSLVQEFITEYLESNRVCSR